MIKLLLVDDHPIVLEGLNSALKKFDDLEIVGEARTGEEALSKTEALSPNLILMDISLPGMTGIEAAKEIGKMASKAKILVLSFHEGSEYVDQAIKAGVSGYLLKDTSQEELVKAIRKINQGGTFFSPRIADCILSGHLARMKETGELPKKLLSKRELEILTRISEGLCNKEIAILLGISIRTVQTHRSRIMEKLNIHTVAGLTRYAISHKLV